MLVVGRIMKTIIVASFIVTVLAVRVTSAEAACNCVAVAGYVDAGVQASVATADSLYAAGDFAGALDLYARAYGDSHDAVLLTPRACAGGSSASRARF